ncbi:MAG: S8 family serine peptidase [Haloechinothrix sp.]
MSPARHPRTLRGALLAASAALLVAGLLGVPSAAARGPALAGGTITAFVELDQPAGIDAYTAERGAGREQARSAARSAKRAVAETARSILAELRTHDPAARALYRTSNAVPGVAVTADAERIRDLAARDDVRAIRPMVPKTRTNAGAAQLTGALESWQRTGRFGDGVRIGIIDDGIDYTHAHFGGPGTPQAYRAIDPTTTDPRYFPTDKVVGGIDLVGDDYDASGENGSTTPDPDPNPLSCGGHGTHVAGSAAGFGVDAQGGTFRGDYAALTRESLQQMRIGPGMAPNALLYGIKVFGCHGSTEVTALALDWALDPNGDGDFSDRLDIVNLSLGSNFGAPDDPDSVFVRKLAQHGVLPVISAGNGGDRYDVSGSPGNTPEALTVASSRDASVLRDAAEVIAPGDRVGELGGQYSQDYADYATLDLTSPVAPISKNNADGCKPFSDADSVAVEGKIVWLEWDDNDTTRACGSFPRAENAEAAGARGVVLSSELEHFAAGLAGNEGVPLFQFTASATAALRPALTEGTLRVRLAGDLRTSLATVDRSIVDTPSEFTSRGVRAPAVKPDVSAPGDTITSAASGSGSGRAVMSGTSMAAPVATGVAALIRQVNPDWSVEEIKAALINTAGHDLMSEESRYAPQRVGAGRIDAKSALDNEILAFVADDPGVVSASFGVIEVDDPLTVSKTITVVNKAAATAEFSVAYEPVTEIPGVRIGLSEDVVRVAPMTETAVAVSVTIDDPASLRKTMDPTVQAIQADMARQFVADASGRVVFTPASGSQQRLRVPVYVAPKPAAAISVPHLLRFAPGQRQAVLNLDGRGLDQGTGNQAYRSMISVAELHASSRRLPPCGEHLDSHCAVNDTARGGDVRYVGAMSTAPLAAQQGSADDALLGFAIATWGTWANVGSNTVPVVRIDTDRDGVADFESYVTKAPGTDVLLVDTVDLHDPQDDGGFASVDLQPVNGKLGDVDTNVFDSDVLVMPVRIAALGIDPESASHRISYTVGVVGYYPAESSTGGVIDSIGRPLSFDPLAPGYRARGAGGPALSHVAEPGATLDVTRDLGSARANKALGLLVLHHHNATGRRAGVVRVVGGVPQPAESAG